MATCLRTRTLRLLGQDYVSPQKALKARKVVFGAFDRGQYPTIDVINKATVPLGNYTVQQLTVALQAYVDQHLAAVWHEHCILRVTNTPDPKNWQLVFVDTADVAGALGYHELTKSGMPISYIFVKTTQQNGGDVAVTASHEVAEMLVDPGIQMWALGPNNVLYAYESADAVEETDFLVNGIRMSNFQYPAWFEGFRRPGSTQFDHLNLCKKPFQLLKGGYSIVMRAGRSQQIFGAKVHSKVKGTNFELAFGSQAKAKQFAKEDRRLHRNTLRMVDGPLTVRSKH
jgi:hypothetical protein